MRRSTRVLAALVAAFPGLGGEARAANRLAGEASPYLQLHAENPVDWYPWGPEAFEKAKRESKPIFLSVGYSTCYWCHVMEREVFSDPEIAALMNDEVVSIKVDREERPDVDEVYMAATQLLRGSGGWPNSLFLTPDGEPFFAGTYFPPKDAPGRPGFPRVVRETAAAWKDRPTEIRAFASRLSRDIAELTGSAPAMSLAIDPDALLRRAAQRLAASYDAEHGGFGNGTKFPAPPKLELLLAAHRASAHPLALEMLTRTLDEMALGGIYDQLAGGFHRYSTEPTWSVPHFEKMLYDNAQLVGLYARAHAVTGRPLYRRVVEGTVAYLDREMSHDEGGFYSAQDAQVDGKEGASYVWTREQVETVLGAERTAAFLSVYALAPMPDGPGAVLRVALPVGPTIERLAEASSASLLARFDAERAALLEARSKRPQPLRDEKVLAAWNGLAIRGLVDAARALGRPEWTRRAARAAEFVLERLRGADGRLHRSYVAGQRRERGVLDDYAFLADGLLALHASTGDARWLRQARALADRMLEDFEDRDGAGFYLTASGSDLFVRPRSLDDGSEPSGNGVALRVLRTLAERTGEGRYADAAERTAAAFGRLFERAPTGAATALVALQATPAAPGAAGMPRSEDHVRVTARRVAGDASRVVVTLVIDPDWHVNANPASLPFLVATSVDVEAGARAQQVAYPEGTPFEPRFSAEPLSVYAGEVAIELRGIEGDGAPLRLAVRYQACDEERCLPPGTSRLEVR